MLVDVEPQSAGSLVTTASVSADQEDPDLANNVATASTTVEGFDPGPRSADLGLTAPGWPNRVDQGQRASAIIVLTNQGPATAEKPSVFLDLPIGMIVESLPSGEKVACAMGNLISCQLADVAPGESVELPLDIFFAKAGALVSSIAATSGQADPDLSNNELTLVTQSIPPAQANTSACRIGVVPAATLLIPYFSVDLGNPGGPTTLFSVTNATAESKLVNVTLWTNWAIPSLSFNTFLTGYDVQTMNVRDLLQGRLPRTGSSFSPAGELSANPVSFPGCGEGNLLTNHGPMEALEADHLMSWHTGEASPLNGLCAGSPASSGDESKGKLATGYITVDVVNECSSLTPADQGYFITGGRGVASNDNAIWGDYFLVNPAQDYAQGEAAIHLIADSELFTGGPTFYGRYNQGAGSDNRQPLGSRYGTRFAQGGVFSGATQMLVWRDTQQSSSSPVACDRQPEWFPLSEQSVLAFDEEENSTLVSDASVYLPLATQKVQVGGADLPLGTAFGWLVMDLDSNDVATGSSTRVHPQGWIVPILSAENRFSVSFRPVRLDADCGY